MKRKENTAGNKPEELTDNRFKKPKTFDKHWSNGKIQENKLSKHNSNNDDNNKSKNKFEKSYNSGKNLSNFPANNDQKTANLPKPNWREIKEEKKKLKVLRKTKKLNDLFEISVEAKKISEIFRRKDCDPENRTQLTIKLHKLLEGNLQKFAFTRDIARVIHWLIKFCSPEIRQSIMTELKPSLLNMMQSKYARNCIKMFLEFGTKDIKNAITSTCHGHVVKLTSHSVASPIIDEVYKTHASDQAKVYFKQEFFGDMYKNSKDDKIKSLADLFKQTPDMKSATLSAIKLNLIKVLNKNLVSLALVQSILAEYLTLCTAQDRTEFIVMLRNSIVNLSHTKDGMKVAIICIRHGTAKDRKISLKSIKDNVKKLATSEHGYLILLSMFDTIDDTVLIKRILFPELLMHLEEIISREYGKKVVLYLVAKRDTRHFHPMFIAQLQEGDENTTSKKPAEIREKELLEGIIEPLLESITNRTTIWLENSCVAMVALAVLKVGTGDKLQPAFQAIADFLINPNSTSKDKDTVYKAMEHPGIHMILKKLIIADKNLIEKNQTTFGEILIKKIDNLVIQQWVELNRACFILISLLKNEKNSVTDILISKLKTVSELLKSKKFPAAPILLENMKNKL